MRDSKDLEHSGHEIVQKEMKKAKEKRELADGGTSMIYHR
jgi:hypothetical protein